MTRAAATLCALILAGPAAASGPGWTPDPFDDPCAHYAKHAPAILEIYGDRLDCAPSPVPTRMALLADDDTLRRFVFDAPPLPPAIALPGAGWLLIAALAALGGISAGSSAPQAPRRLP